jgi:ribosome maturation factor RimP
MAKAVEKQIEDMIAGDIASAGYDLVRVQVTGSGKYTILQIMAERQDGKGMTVDDCAVISKAVTEKLEADKDLVDKYDLEVSSPGIDRPLIKPADYERFAGHVAKVELSAPQNGQRRFQGKIAGVKGEEVELAIEKGNVVIPFAAIEKAKLVLTDELLKAAASGKVTH